MKKIIAAIALVGFTAAAFAQGTVNWFGVGGAFVGQTNGTAYSSFESTAGAAPASGTQGSTLGNTAANNTALGYSGYYYELLVSASAAAVPASLANLSSWSDTGLTATNAGGSNGRIGQIGANTQAVANNWAAGTQANVVLVGWSANLGTTWSAALANLQNWSTVGSGFTSAAYFGVSMMGTLTSGTGNPGVTIFGATTGQINNSPSLTPAGTPMQMYQLAVVPEPGTIALACLGGASLLLFRRKK